VIGWRDGVAANPGAVPRFKIGRGTLVDFRSLIWKLLAGIAIWIAAFVALVTTVGPAMKGFVLLGPAGLVAMVLSLIVYLNLPGRLHVGTDGVLVDWRGDKRYVPFSEIEDAPPYAEDILGKRMIGVELRLRGAPPVKVPIGEDQFGADKRVAELSGAIRAALEGYRRLAAADDAAFLARGERTKEAWLAHLRGLGEGANAGPREAPIPVERLWRIALDPSAGAAPAPAPPWRSRAASTRPARSASGSRPSPQPPRTCDSPWKPPRQGTKRRCRRPLARWKAASDHHASHRFRPGPRPRLRWGPWLRGQ
jgi:hypothetical protein